MAIEAVAVARAANDAAPAVDKVTALVQTPSAPRETWSYPDEMAHDLDGVDLPENFKGEAIACACEYTRSVIPSHTNWARYVAYARIVLVGIVAEFRGSLVDVAHTDAAVGFDVQTLIDTLFAGTPGHEEMGREYRAFLVITADKSSGRRDGEMFRRYCNAMAASPRLWFRLRDCDSLTRLTIAAVLACNDRDDVWLSEPE